MDIFVICQNVAALARTCVQHLAQQTCDHCILHVFWRKNCLGYRSAAEQQSGHPGKWNQMLLPSRERRILASHFLQRKFVPTSALQQTKHLHNLGQFETRIVWAKFLRLRLLLSIWNSL